MALECLVSGICVDVRPPPTWPGPRPRPGTPPASPLTAGQLADILVAASTVPVALTREAALEAAKACLAKPWRVFWKDIQDPCDGSAVRLYFPGGRDLPDHADHIADAQRSRPEWFILQRRKPPLRNRWYRNDPTCLAASAEGQACGEYPFASSIQGGPGASLRGVSKAESSWQGTTIGAHFYDRAACAPFEHGQAYAVVPVRSPTVPIFGVCR